MPLADVIDYQGQPGGAYTAGAGAINALTDAQLKTAAQGVSNQFQPGILQNQLTAGQLANQRSQATLPYAGPQAAADLSQTQLGNQKNKLLLPYVVPTAQSDIAQKNAQANYLGTEADVNKAKIPGIQWASANPQTQVGGVAGIFGLQDWANKTGDTNLANNINSYFASKAQPDAKSLDTVTKARNGAATVIQNENPGISNSEAHARQLAYENGADQNGNFSLPDGTKIPPPSAAVQNSLSEVYKNANTANKLKTQAAALNAERALQVLTPYAKGASQYSGTFGHLKLIKDGIETSMGANIPTYQDFQKFSKFAPEAAVQMITASQAHGNIPMINSYKSLIDPVTWKNNPVGSYENLQNLVSLYRATTGTTAGMTPQQIQTALTTETARSLQPGAQVPASNISTSQNVASSNTPQKLQAKAKKSDVYVLRDPQGNRIRGSDGKAIGGNDSQTRSFIKDHPGFSREKLSG